MTAATCPYCGTQYEIVKYPGSNEPVGQADNARRQILNLQAQVEVADSLVEKLEAKLAAMTATMQQWRDLAKSVSGAHDALLQDVDGLRERNEGLVKDVAHLKKVANNVMAVPGIVDLLVNHLLEPWDDNQAGLGEPELMEEEDDYCTG